MDKSILRKISEGVYAIRYDDAGDGGGDGGGGGDNGGEGGGLGGQKGGDGGGLGGYKGAGDDGGDNKPVVYDFSTDPAKLGELDLGGSLIEGKYKTVKDLAEGYNEARKKATMQEEALAQKLGFVVPETYDFGDLGKEWKPEEAAAVTEQFKAIGLNQEQALKAIPGLTELAQQFVDARDENTLMKAWGKTGAEFEVHRDRVIDWANRNLDEALFNKFDAMGVEGLRAAELLMEASKERPLWGGGENADTGNVLEELRKVEQELTKESPHGARRKELEAKRWKLYQIAHPGGGEKPVA